MKTKIQKDTSCQRKIESLCTAGLKVTLHNDLISWQFRIGVSLFALLRYLRRSDAYVDEHTYVAGKRASEKRSVRYFKPIAPIQCEPVMVNQCPAEWIVSAGQNTNELPQTTILYLHGGSFTGGSLATHRALCGSIAHVARARVLLIEYRLAPEHPFPAALDDTVAAYHWLLEQGIQPKNLIIAGDSSGGGLALSALNVLRDSSIPLPRAGICLSAITDLTCNRETWDTHAKNEVVTTVTSARRSVVMYLNGTDPHDPLASPVYGDLSGLPPLLLQVGSKEVLLDDAIHFARAAHTAGVDVTLDVWNGMVHSWQHSAALAPEARAAVETIGEFVRRLPHVQGSIVLETFQTPPI